MPTTCGPPNSASTHVCAGTGSPEGCRCGPEAAGGDDLARRLLACAPHGTGERAALEVLAVHGRWLCDRGFVLSCVRSFGGQAWVRWPVVRRFLVRTPCSDLDHEVLLMACELATADSDRRFRRSVVLHELDEGLRNRLAGAIGHPVGATRGAAEGV